MSLVDAGIEMRIMEAVAITGSQGIPISRHNLLIPDNLELFSVKVSIQKLR